jgi:hypothetical protein
MIKLFVAGCTLVLLLQLSCKDNAVGPVFKDPRTYTWTIDTLSYPGSYQTNMQDVWGSSATDVYVVGHNDQNRGLMWHFDGKSWTDVQLSTTQGGNIQGPIDLRAVSGFKQNDVFAIGEKDFDNPNPPPRFLDSGLIIHFDGRKWQEQKIVGARNLTSIWGSSQMNLWTGGWMKYLYHSDGIQWHRDSLPVIVPQDGFFQINALEGVMQNDVFAIGYTAENTSAKTMNYFFHKHSISPWALLDSFVVEPGRIENKWGFGDMWVSPTGALYSCGAGVYKWNTISWQKLFDHPNFLSRMTGTGDNNIFVVGHLGTVLQFNGQDWYQYQQFANPNMVLWGAWTDGAEVFIVGFIASFPQKTIILHGK